MQQNHLIKNPILFCKYLGPLILHRIGLVFKICVWISVFKRKNCIENPILSCQDIKQKPSLIFFGTPCMFLHHTGRPEKMKLGFCLISQQPSAGFSNPFFLLKTEIHTQILNIKPFLCDLRGPRYLRNKMGFVTEAIVLNLHFFDFHLSGIWKDDKN